MATETTSIVSTSPTEALFQAAKQALGEEYPKLHRFMEISARLFALATEPTDEGKIQQVCATLHELLNDCKALLPEEEWATLNVAIDSVISVSLKLAISPSVLPVSPADVNVEVVETVAVGCFRGLLRACIARVAAPTKSTHPANPST
jgi:hypothetical protein